MEGHELFSQEKENTHKQTPLSSMKCDIKHHYVMFLTFWNRLNISHNANFISMLACKYHHTHSPAVPHIVCQNFAYQSAIDATTSNNIHLIKEISVWN